MPTQTEEARRRKSREKGALKVAREIVRHIHEERIPVGQKYLSEAEAIEKYQVARGTLREALRYLQIQGVIEIRPGPNGGHFVAHPRWDNLASSIALLLQFSDATIESIIEARVVIEPGMAALAAQNATDEDIAGMRAIQNALKNEIGNYETFYALYMNFWDRLAATTKNALFIFLSPALRRITWTAGIRPSETLRETALSNIGKVLDAVAAHDENKAVKAMKHLEESYLQTMRKDYPREISKPVSWSNFR